MKDKDREALERMLGAYHVSYAFLKVENESNPVELFPKWRNEHASST